MVLSVSFLGMLHFLFFFLLDLRSIFVLNGGHTGVYVEVLFFVGAEGFSFCEKSKISCVVFFFLALFSCLFE